MNHADDEQRFGHALAALNDTFEIGERAALRRGMVLETISG